jgi:hypothetical protein
MAAAEMQPSLGFRSLVFRTMKKIPPDRDQVVSLHFKNIGRPLKKKDKGRTVIFLFHPECGRKLF